LRFRLELGQTRKRAECSGKLPAPFSRGSTGERHGSYKEGTGNDARQQEAKTGNGIRLQQAEAGSDSRRQEAKTGNDVRQQDSEGRGSGSADVPRHPVRSEGP